MDYRAKKIRDNLNILSSLQKALDGSLNSYLSAIQPLISQEDLKLIQDCKMLLISNVGELLYGLELSKMLDEIVKEFKITKPIFTSNIDKIVRVGDEIKAVFELKHSTNGKDFFLKFNHHKTLELLSKKLGVPVYYIVKNGDWYLKEINEIRNFKFTGDQWIKRIPLNSMKKLTKEDLASILR